jgi:hypothetical protein
MFNMLKTISLLVYISFIHTIYIDKLNPYFKKEAGKLLAAATATENITKVRPMRGKLCNFKCDCFFSHSVKNDNICVPIWIRPLGL